MISHLMEQFASQAPAHLQNTDTRTALKFSAAMESARKAGLRTLYGMQPGEGFYWGSLRYAMAKGSVITVEVFFPGFNKPSGVFELPLHFFRRNGKSIACTAEVEDFVGGYVDVEVTGRHRFNGVSLSTVTAIELCSPPEPILIAQKLVKQAQK